MWSSAVPTLLNLSMRIFTDRFSTKNSFPFLYFNHTNDCSVQRDTSTRTPETTVLLLLLKHCFHSVWMCSHAIYEQYIRTLCCIRWYIRTYTHTYILYVMSPTIEYQTFRHPLLPSSVIMAYRLGAAETSGICKNPTYVRMYGRWLCKSTPNPYEW